MSKPRIVSAQMGNLVAVSELSPEIEKYAKQALFEGARRPVFRWRGRWPYRAFGKPYVVNVVEDVDMFSGRKVIYLSAKWNRAVALWRKS